MDSRVQKVASRGSNSNKKWRLQSGGMNKLLVALMLLAPLIGAAETVDVKYRGPVNLSPFTCETVTRSSVVRRVCYDSRERYMLISLNGTYYHYCEIPEQIVNALQNAGSMGRFYNAYIKGNYDCRLNRMPNYR